MLLYFSDQVVEVLILPMSYQCHKVLNSYNASSSSYN